MTAGVGDGDGSHRGWDLGGFSLAIQGPPRAVGHFVAEYGATYPISTPRLIVRFGKAGPDAPGSGHKGTRWRMAISRPDADPITATIAVGGPFGLPLVQSLLVEPLLGLSAPAGEAVLVPGAAIRLPNGRLVLVLGRSASGKTSLALAAVLRGASMLCDDHFVLAADGRVIGMPRRMRIYPDAEHVHRGLAGRLPRTVRSRLRALRLLDRLSGGLVKLPALVRPSVLAVPELTGWMQPDDIVLIERVAEAGDLREDVLAVAALSGLVRELLAEERRHVVGLAGPEWSRHADQLADRESVTVARAWEGMQARRIRVPKAWPAERSFAALLAAIGVP